MDDKMNVPDGMLSAAYEYCPASFAMPAVEAMLEAALKWLDGELKRHHNSNTNSWQAGYNVAIEDVRRMFRVTPEHKDGTVVWRAGTTIPIGVWSGGKIYTTNVPDPLKLCERDNDGDGNCDIHSSPGVFRNPSFNKKKEESFVECDTCRAKPGSPTLCYGCLHNREIICSLHRELKSIKDTK